MYLLFVHQIITGCCDRMYAVRDFDDLGNSIDYLQLLSSYPRVEVIIGNATM